MDETGLNHLCALYRLARDNSPPEEDDAFDVIDDYLLNHRRISFVDGNPIVVWDPLEVVKQKAREQGWQEGSLEGFIREIVSEEDFAALLSQFFDALAFGKFPYKER